MDPKEAREAAGQEGAAAAAAATVANKHRSIASASLLHSLPTARQASMTSGGMAAAAMRHNDRRDELLRALQEAQAARALGPPHTAAPASSAAATALTDADSAASSS